MWRVLVFLLVLSQGAFAGSAVEVLEAEFKKALDEVKSLQADIQNKQKKLDASLRKVEKLMGAVSVSESGNVGIGITNPTTALEIMDNSNFGDVNDKMTRAFRIQQKDGGGFVVQPFNGDGFTKDNPLWIINSHYNEPIAIQAGASGSFKPSKAVYFSVNGNIGIGTTDPKAKLDVNGNIKAKSFEGQVKKFSGFGTELETNTADKGFLGESNCKIGAITAAIEVGQAAVCVCVDGEKGKGWYCFN